MDRKLNRTLALCLFVLVALYSSAQEERIFDKDYKDREQFEKFTRRRKVVAAWQISQLKEGALVVRLKTNILVVNALIKQGNTRLAEQKRVEMLAINRNIMKAYRDFYTFSNLYFIYSYSSDSLLNGTRSNIFLDSTLTMNAAITMTETFYLLAERDYAYNSSIGFVPEDSARIQIEKGNAVKEMAVVVKNKYGHQLKRPFPYYEGDKPKLNLDDSPMIFLNINGFMIPFAVYKDGRLASLRRPDNPEPGKTRMTFDYRDSTLKVDIPKYLTYSRLAATIRSFNEDLYHYYRNSPHLTTRDLEPSVKPFLY